MAEPGVVRTPVRAVLIETGGRYYFYEPGLAVIGSGDALEEAYERFVRSRQEYMAEAEKAGLRPHQTQTGQDVGRLGMAQELALFFAKTCIAILVIGGIGAMAVLPLGTISVRDLGNKMALVAKDLQELKPEEKEGMRQSLGVISREVSPLGEAWRQPAQHK